MKNNNIETIAALFFPLMLILNLLERTILFIKNINSEKSMCIIIIRLIYDFSRITMSPLSGVPVQNAN